MEKGGEDWDGDILIHGVPEPGGAKLASAKKMLSRLKEREKGGKIFVTSKAPCTVDDEELLINTEVYGSQVIRDDSPRLVRGHLDDGLSLLEMDCSPNK